MQVSPAWSWDALLASDAEVSYSVPMNTRMEYVALGEWKPGDGHGLGDVSPNLHESVTLSEKKKWSGLPFQVVIFTTEPALFSKGGILWRQTINDSDGRVKQKL